MRESTGIIGQLNESKTRFIILKDNENKLSWEYLSENAYVCVCVWFQMHRKVGAKSQSGQTVIKLHLSFVCNYFTFRERERERV